MFLEIRFTSPLPRVGALTLIITVKVIVTVKSPVFHTSSLCLANDEQVSRPCSTKIVAHNPIGR